jgi:alpha-glucoside transport system substrate-binding protein
VLATPGRLREYAKDGTLRPLDAALGRSKLADQYGPGWLDLMQATGPAGEDHYYAIIVKATLKCIVWYEPRRLPAAERAQLTSPDLNWDGLTGVAGRLAARGIPPWCMGMEDSSNSGWPGTDWIEDILLHQSGPAAYDRWIDGTLSWQSTPVRQAWRTWGRSSAPGWRGTGRHQRC